MARLAFPTDDETLETKAWTAATTPAFLDDRPTEPTMFDPTEDVELPLTPRYQRSC